MIKKALKLFGIDLSLIIENIKGVKFYLSDIKKIKSQNNKEVFGPIRYYPILTDKNDFAGSLSGHYFHQDLFVAQRIFQNNPERHIDIGSRIDGFVTHVATFRKIEVFDIRKQKSSVENIIFQCVDFMKDIPTEYISCTDSVSSLHAIEHFGLGRYGDSVDINGHLKGLDNINKILKKGGIFYLSVPIGAQRIDFNAHRVFSLEYILGILKSDYELNNFAYVDDLGNIHKDITLKDEEIKSSLNCKFGCGIFELIKK